MGNLHGTPQKEKPSIGGLGIEFFGSLGSPSLIGQMTYQLQMGWVATQSVVAQMVNLLLTWHVAEVVGVDHDMRSYGLPVQGHATIVASPASPGSGTTPQVARGRGVVQLESGINDFAALLQTGNDGSAPVRVGQVFDFFFHGKEKATGRWLLNLLNSC